MRLTKWAAGLVIALAVGTTRSRADEQEYDLRGPAPKKGQVYQSKGAFKIKGANSVIKLGGQTIKSKYTESTTSEQEVKVLAVEGRQVTRCQTKIIKDVTETTEDSDGEETTEKETSPLQGEVIISEFVAPRKWKHVLVDTKPNDEQKKKLDDLTGPDNDDSLYPEGKVKVGHTWKADASGLVNFFDASFSDLKGEMTQKFVKVEEVGGEECAVVETTGVLTAKAKTEEGVLDIRMDIKRTVWRSLASGVDVKDRTTGKLKYSGKIEIDGAEADYLLEGPFEATGTTRVK
ncbi:MAG TPA: hypothetical protein VKE74_30120 [Gemmataceae bacterium]|nr:hypothetical protein [Gemmataceae bacterium]